jgi:hypothetical protein
MLWASAAEAPSAFLATAAQGLAAGPRGHFPTETLPALGHDVSGSFKVLLHSGLNYNTAVYLVNSNLAIQ